MKQTLASAVIVGLFTWTAALAAQESSSQSQSSATPPKATAHRTASRATAAQKETVTVTGCLQDNGTSQTSSTEATRTPANKYPTYMLANASANGNGASASASANAGSYILQGMDLSREIGQQVEVTATTMPAPRSRTRVRGTTGSTEESQPAPHLWVSSVKMISPTCSGQP